MPIGHVDRISLKPYKDDGHVRKSVRLIDNLDKFEVNSSGQFAECYSRELSAKSRARTNPDPVCTPWAAVPRKISHAKGKNGYHFSEPVACHSWPDK